jgi:hypothetical protein
VRERQKRDTVGRKQRRELGRLTEFRGGNPIGSLADHFEGVSMLWWTGLQADRHEMEDGHAAAQVAALVNNKTGYRMERRKGA